MNFNINNLNDPINLGPLGNMRPTEIAKYTLYSGGLAVICTKLALVALGTITAPTSPTTVVLGAAVALFFYSGNKIRFTQVGENLSIEISTSKTAQNLFNRLKRMAGW